MYKWMARQILSYVWKAKTISVPLLRGRALVIKEIVDDVLDKTNDGVLDIQEQHQLMERLINACL